MNKFLSIQRYKFFFLAAFVIFLFVSQSNAQISGILDRIEKHRQSLQTLRANIKMGKYDGTTREWSVNEGKVILIAKSNKIKNDYLRIDWSKPRPEMISVVNGKYVAYTPGLKQAYVGEASGKTVKGKGGSAFSVLQMSRAQLTASYAPQQLANENLDGVDTFHLRFSPRAASEYKNIEIWVDINGMILQVKTTPPSGDETYVRLSNIEKNVTLKPSEFNVALPAGLKPIKM
jgi:outer membrane lipoprotein-sorting protein